MSYAIIQFTCTKLGNEAIKDYENENTHELTADEIKALWLISQYQSLKDSNAKKTVNSVETDFQKLYLSVNLSRLVAMKLIVFDPKAQEKAEKKEIQNSTVRRTGGSKSNKTGIGKKNVGRKVNSFAKSAVSSISGKTTSKKPVNAISKKTATTNSNVEAPVNVKKKPSKIKKAEDLSDIAPAILLAAGRY